MSQIINLLFAAPTTDGVAPAVASAVASATALGAAPASSETPAVLAYVGEIRLLPFRHDELPSGWYFCNGERFLLNSPQGGVLSGLSDNFRADWGITEDMCSVGLPNLFQEDGRGCFMRAVDGESRQVGAWEGDAIRNIKGYYAGICSSTQPTNGLFQYKSSSGGFQGGSVIYYCTDFDASRVVPTAPENRPLNLGMTPAIYLGV